MRARARCDARIGGAARARLRAIAERRIAVRIGGCAAPCTAALLLGLNRCAGATRQLAASRRPPRRSRRPVARPAAGPSSPALTRRLSYGRLRRVGMPPSTTRLESFGGSCDPCWVP